MSDAVDERDLQVGRARVVETGGLAAYYADLDRHETGALWTVANKIEPWEPVPSSDPVLWRHAEAEDGTPDAAREHYEGLVRELRSAGLPVLSAGESLPEACPITSCMSVIRSPESVPHFADRSASSFDHANSDRRPVGLERS
mgnify:CR=1 FL=1